MRLPDCLRPRGVAVRRANTPSRRFGVVVRGGVEGRRTRARAPAVSVGGVAGECLEGGDRVGVVGRITRYSRGRLEARWRGGAATRGGLGAGNRASLGAGAVRASSGSGDDGDSADAVD